MFSFTGLSEKQVQILREKWHIYMVRPLNSSRKDDVDADDEQTKNGRISMAGLNTHNVDYVAEAIDSAVRETQ